MNNVMVDLETLGKRAGSMIVSIGAVEFDPSEGKLGREIYLPINIEKSRGTVDCETIKWWMSQKDSAQAVFNDDRACSLEEAHSDFAYFIGGSSTAEFMKNLELLKLGKEASSNDEGPDAYMKRISTKMDNTKIWGNGADFDNVILATSYDILNKSVPWKFWNNRCYRTIKSLAPHIKIDHIGTHHNALDDAKSQALHLIRIWQALDLDRAARLDYA